MPLPVPTGFGPSKEPDDDLNLPSDFDQSPEQDETFQQLTVDETLSGDRDENAGRPRWKTESTGSGATAYSHSEDEDDWDELDDLVNSTRFVAPHPPEGEPVVTTPATSPDLSLGATSVAPVDQESATKKKGRKSKVKENRPTEFVDRKSKKLLPFGRKTVVDPSSFDTRNDLRKKARRVQLTIFTLLTLLVLLGVKNAVFPPTTLDEEEVASIAAEVNGSTGFPLNSGAGFAQDFMKAYLSVNTSEGDQKALSYFYSGSLKEGETPTDAIQADSRFRQTVVTGPTVYSRTALTPYSGSYTVGALVQPVDTNAPAPTDGSSLRWVFFNVEVYYDEKTGRFAIPDGSPSVVPGPSAKSSSDVPPQAPIADVDADETLNSAVEATVVGFVKGYAVSTVDEHTSLDQYVVDPEDFQLVGGLGKGYTLSGSASEAIEFTSYPVSENEVKVKLKVQWKSTVNSSSSAVYTSNYVMTLQKNSDGKYLVSSFSPLHYEAEEE